VNQVTVKIPKGLVTEIAKQRCQVSAYETHRGFKALAFYLLVRTLTTSAGIYRSPDSRRDDGYQSWSSLNKEIGIQIGMSFNTVNQLAAWAKDFGFITIDHQGYKFRAIEKIVMDYAIWDPTGDITFEYITLNPKDESLEHILKTLVFGENFAKQEYAVMQRIKRIPGVIEKLGNYIENWQSLPVKKLLEQIVAWQKKTFTEYTKGTEVYDLFHSIHADIALTCKTIKRHFAFKCTRSSTYLKRVLSKLQYINVESRKVLGYATRLPHEPDGKSKPVKFTWMPQQKMRLWSMPDLITLNLKKT
jgi:hypothetical protein